MSVEQRLRAWDDVCPDLQVLLPHLRGQEFVQRGLDGPRAERVERASERHTV